MGVPPINQQGGIDWSSFVWHQDLQQKRAAEKNTHKIFFEKLKLKSQIKLCGRGDFMEFEKTLVGIKINKDTP